MSEMMNFKDKSELAMMGKVVPVASNEEALAMTEYIVGVIKPDAHLCEDFINNSICRYQKNKVKFIVCNVLLGDMPCITYLLENADEREDYDYPAPFKENYGYVGYKCAFCYVFNLADDWCSEFGDCFFEKKSDGYYHRVS